MHVCMGAFVYGMVERFGLCVLAWCRGFENWNLRKGFACNDGRAWAAVMIRSIMTQELTLIDRIIEAKEIKRTISIPVKEFKAVEVL